MGEMIRQDGALNFRVAGGTIFAGAKIYASRVDAIHSQIYRYSVVCCKNTGVWCVIIELSICVHHTFYISNDVLY